MSRVVVLCCPASRPADPWRWLVIALGALILCSCQALESTPHDQLEFVISDRPAQLAESGSLTSTAPSPTISGAAAAPVDDAQTGRFRLAQAESDQPPPPPVQDELDAARQQLHERPPYIEASELGPAELRRDDATAVEVQASPQRCLPNDLHPWGQPQDEYVCDGGDDGVRVRVSGTDFSIRGGLDPSDTIAHYDTLDGRRVVEASSRACVYAPRFAATRKIVRVEQEQLVVGPSPVVSSDQPLAHVETAELGRVKWPQAVDAQITHVIGHIVQQHDPARLKENVISLDEARRRLLPYENLELVRSGSFNAQEELRLQEGLDAAVAWSSAVALQVLLEDKPASVTRSVAGGQDIVVYELQPGAPQLRLIKLASKCEAQPGETLHFTIRFDNVGNEAIGNVTIIDDLPSRLEYVDGSADCSLAHEIFTETNSSGSATLRCEISDPLETGEGGVLRFECLVR